MINEIELENFGPLAHVEWKNLGGINLIIGENGTGKSFLLKAIYATIKTLEDLNQNNEPRDIDEILADRLHWTFQAGKIGDLASTNTDRALVSKITFNEINEGFSKFEYSFTQDAGRKNINILENNTENLQKRCIFLPAKEVLSVQNTILKSRLIDKIFGFDDGYFDLVVKLRYLANNNSKELIEKIFSRIDRAENTRNKNKNNTIEFLKNIGAEKMIKIKDEEIKRYEKSRDLLKKITNGDLKYEEVSENWVFLQNDNKFPMGITSEGIKKISIIETLLKTGYLSSDSVVLIDEPESNLHPSAISKLMDIVAELSECGIQFFMATHSYFVIKKLYLIAQEKKWSIPVLSANGNDWVANDLLDGMPKNSIIDESIKLYHQEVELKMS